jgi:hypothetical protein
MVKTQMIRLACIAPALALFNCAAPKAVVVEEQAKPVEKKAEEPVIADVPMPVDPNDGLRGIDEMMLALPGDNEFRATVPVTPRGSNDANAVIARPPTDPPPRQKPQE